MERTTAADAAVPASVMDGARMPDATADGDTGGPPSDFACKNAWLGDGDAGADAEPGCTGVRVVMLVASETVTVGGVSIARTPSGRIGVAYDDTVPVDAQGLTVASFQAPASATSQLRVASVGIGFASGSRAGVAHSLAASGATHTSDTLLATYVDEIENELLFQAIPAGDAGLSPAPVVIATGVGSGAHVSLVASSTAGVEAAYFVPSLGAVRAAKLLATGAFATPTEAVTGVNPTGAGSGELSLFVDNQGTPDLLYESCVTGELCAPTYTTYAGAWSMGFVVDGTQFSALAGYSPSLVANGQTKYASYFVVEDLASGPTAELHLASWTSPASAPTISILDSMLPAALPDAGPAGSPFRFASAMAIDGFGLLHLVVVRPDPTGEGGQLVPPARSSFRVAGVRGRPARLV